MNIKSDYTFLCSVIHHLSTTVMLFWLSSFFPHPLLLSFILPTFAFSPFIFWINCYRLTDNICCSSMVIPWTLLVLMKFGPTDPQLFLPEPSLFLPLYDTISHSYSKKKKKSQVYHPFSTNYRMGNRKQFGFYTQNI